MKDVVEVLKAWVIDAGSVCADNYTSPTIAAIVKAMHLAEINSTCHPLRVVENGDGGIVFEFVYVGITQTWEIDSDGSAEWMVFVDSTLIIWQTMP